VNENEYDILESMVEQDPNRYYTVFFGHNGRADMDLKDGTVYITIGNTTVSMDYTYADTMVEALSVLFRETKGEM